MQDDGVRSLEDPWHYSNVLHVTLSELGISWVVLSKNMMDLTARVEHVCEILRLRGNNAESIQ